MSLNNFKLMKTSDIVNIFKQNGHEQFVTTVQQRNINGETILNLNEGNILQWGLPVKERKILWSFISELKQNPAKYVSNTKAIAQGTKKIQSGKINTPIKGKLEMLLFNNNNPNAQSATGAVTDKNRPELPVKPAQTLPRNNTHKHTSDTRTLPKASSINFDYQPVSGVSGSDTKALPKLSSDNSDLNVKIKQPPPPPSPNVLNTNKNQPVPDISGYMSDSKTLPKASSDSSDFNVKRKKPLPQPGDSNANTNNVNKLKNKPLPELPTTNSTEDKKRNATKPLPKLPDGTLDRNKNETKPLPDLPTSDPEDELYVNNDVVDSVKKNKPLPKVPSNDASNKNYNALQTNSHKLPPLPVSMDDQYLSMEKPESDPLDDNGYLKPKIIEDNVNEITTRKPLPVPRFDDDPISQKIETPLNPKTTKRPLPILHPVPNNNLRISKKPLPPPPNEYVTEPSKSADEDNIYEDSYEMAPSPNSRTLKQSSESVEDDTYEPIPTIPSNRINYENKDIVENFERGAVITTLFRNFFKKTNPNDHRQPVVSYENHVPQSIRNRPLPPIPSPRPEPPPYPYSGPIDYPFATRPLPGGFRSSPLDFPPDPPPEVPNNYVGLMKNPFENVDTISKTSKAPTGAISRLKSKPRPPTPTLDEPAEERSDTPTGLYQNYEQQDSDDEQRPEYVNREATNFYGNENQKPTNNLPKPPVNLVEITSNLPPQVAAEENIDDEYVNTFIGTFNVNDEPYFRNTDRKGAKELLRDLEDGAFLFRKSNHYFLTLTIKYQQKYFNLGIIKTPQNKVKCYAEGSSDSPEFSTLGDFIRHFQQEPLTLQDKHGIIDIRLKPMLPLDRF